VDGSLSDHNLRRTIMSTLTIGRYEHESITKDYAGYIEPADKSWIIYLDADGKPSVYYPEREADGAVIGDGITL
jgi:hypothetical protein